MVRCVERWAVCLPGLFSHSHVSSFTDDRGAHVHDSCYIHRHLIETIWLYKKYWLSFQTGAQMWLQNFHRAAVRNITDWWKRTAHAIIIALDATGPNEVIRQSAAGLCGRAAAAGVSFNYQGPLCSAPGSVFALHLWKPPPLHDWLLQQNLTRFQSSSLRLVAFLCIAPLPNFIRPQPQSCPNPENLNATSRGAVLLSVFFFPFSFH